MISDAVLSPDGLYRYRLERTWSESSPLTWIMLNPSTADAEEDDPTIRRCIRFAKDHCYGGIVVVNLFALRTPYPKMLWNTTEDPFGPLNNTTLLGAAANAHTVVAAWGAGKRAAIRGAAVVRMMDRPLVCLGHTAQGHPRHPLYVRSTQEFEPYQGAP